MGNDSTGIEKLQDLIEGCFVERLSVYGFAQVFRTPHGLNFASDTMQFNFGFGQQGISISLQPLPSDKDDDPDQISLVALLVFLKLIEPTDRMLTQHSDIPRLRQDLERCATLLPKIKDYLLGRITDYSPIWDRIDDGSLFE